MRTIGEICEREEFVTEWSIKDFSSLSVEKDVCYGSPLFSFADASWYLTIYPNRKTGNDSEGGISLYLCRDSSGPPITVAYILGMKTVDGKLDPEEDFTHVFKRIASHGIFNILGRTQLFKKKSKLLPSDTLTLVCRINCPTFTEFKTKKYSSKSSKNLLENKVFKDYKELFLKKKECDVIIKVKEQEFPAHRIILAARSSVFESTFRNDMKEKETGIVDIEDCDPSSFSEFLCFLYCGETETLSEANVFSLFTTADKYDVQDLKDICVKFMKENISVDTFCDTIRHALQYSQLELITLTTDFFLKNAIKIAKTVKWQSFSADNPTASTELFIKALEAEKCLNKSLKRKANFN